MILSKRQLFSLVAVTLKGVRVGRVVDVGLDSIAQSIVTYQVRPFWQLKKKLGMNAILSTPLSINRQSVVRMTETELIIEDASIAELEQGVRVRAASLEAHQGVVGRKRAPVV